VIEVEAEVVNRATKKTEIVVALRSVRNERKQQDKLAVSERESAAKVLALQLAETAHLKTIAKLTKDVKDLKDAKNSKDTKQVDKAKEIKTLYDALVIQEKLQGKTVTSLENDKTKLQTEKTKLVNEKITLTAQIATLTGSLQEMKSRLNESDTNAKNSATDLTKQIAETAKVQTELDKMNRAVTEGQLMTVQEFRNLQDELSREKDENIRMRTKIEVMTLMDGRGMEPTSRTSCSPYPSAYGHPASNPPSHRLYRYHNRDDDPPPARSEVPPVPYSYRSPRPQEYRREEPQVQRRRQSGGGGNPRLEHEHRRGPVRRQSRGGDRGPVFIDNNNFDDEYVDGTYYEEYCH
jgi:hypothetical protein